MANFNIPYKIEREGQIEFFDNYGIPYNDDASILVDNTDGIYNGNIFEFKLNISNLNKTLFQAIKYLSRMRVKGESVPATILLIDLNATTVYVYKSKDYFDAIHKIYTGAASKDNDGFVAGNYDLRLDYSDITQSAQVKKILKGRKVNPDEMYMPVDIDENCIVGWAQRYYREIPNASKGDFLGDDTGTAVKVTGEIREPRHFKGLINPYIGKSNEKFKYLMDCLNDRLSKKDLGAFYTPIPYAKKAAELVQMAVDRVPDGNDYIILDRCAGTGNLEAALVGLTDKNGDELIEHCVVSTYEYYEYKVLQERIGDKVRDIIPPTEANVVYENGKVANADAMSEDFINNPIIRQYIDDPKCSIILFENPPFNDESSGMSNGAMFRSGKKNSYILEKMKNEVKGVATNDLSNRFIWSAQRFYLREPTDSYVVFSPAKYWKQYSFVTMKAEKAFLFNRGYFHATNSAITCILWFNELANQDSISADVYDIESEEAKCIAKRVIKKVQSPASRFYSKYAFTPDDEISVYCAKDGTEAIGKTVRVKSYHTSDVIAYLEADSFQIAPHVRNITVVCLYNGHGCYLTHDRYKDILPIWVAKHVPLENWYDTDIYCSTSDGGNVYTKDPQFLKSCLIFTCLSNQNKCLSFDASDGRRYQNELCFDDNRAIKPLALQDLGKYASVKTTELDEEETKLLEVWNQIMAEAKKTAKYNPEFNFGVYQISKELNTVTIIGTGSSKRKKYDYPVLNGHLDTLRVMLKAYYKSHITEKMFKYELLK